MAEDTIEDILNRNSPKNNYQNDFLENILKENAPKKVSAEEELNSILTREAPAKYIPSYGMSPQGATISMVKAELTVIILQSLVSMLANQ